MSALELATRPGRTLLVPFALGCAVLAERILIGVPTGGRGALALVTIAAPLAAVMTIFVYGSRRSLGFLASPVFVFGVAPYLLLTALLPVFGIMFHDYPVRTLWSSTEATTAMSFMVIGAALSSRDDRSWWPWLLLAIVVQFLYGMGQLAYLTRGPGSELFAPLHQMDLSAARAYGVLGTGGRSTGLYFNPNELGLWAAAAVVLAWLMLPPRLRVLGVVLAVLTLLLSQSRGALVALVAAMVAAVVMSAARGRTGPSSAAKTAISFGLAALVAGAVVVAMGPSTALVARLGALLDVLSQGPRADVNLAGRLDYWSGVVNLNMVYPWGTWGSPQLLLGTAIDSSWFGVFAQGSVLYVVSLALLLVAPLWLRNTRVGPALVPMAVLIAVAGLTQNPFSYPVIILFWVLLGAGTQASADALTAPRAPARRPAAGTGPAATRRPGPRAPVAPGGQDMAIGKV